MDGSKVYRLPLQSLHRSPIHWFRSSGIDKHGTGILIVK
ncbi:MAG: hypothetical protein ACJAUG_001050 [Halioglobus sp.]|jgi:hypothetical protein